MLRQVADGVLIHQSELLQNNTIVVQGRAGVLLAITLAMQCDPIKPHVESVPGRLPTERRQHARPHGGSVAP
jgi:hypothetical protein